jgi:hypothetical protein
MNIDLDYKALSKFLYVNIKNIFIVSCYVLAYIFAFFYNNCFTLEQNMLPFPPGNLFKASQVRPRHLSKSWKN